MCNDKNNLWLDLEIPESQKLVNKKKVTFGFLHFFGAKIVFRFDKIDRSV